MSRLVSFFSLSFLAGVFVLGLAGCGAAPHADTSAAMMANCTMCKAQYEWTYTPKGVALGRKEIKHKCPMCKADWVAGVDAGSTCPECAKAELACPKCQMAGKK